METISQLMQVVGTLNWSGENLAFALLAGVGAAIALSAINLGPLARFATGVANAASTIVARRAQIDLGAELHAPGQVRIEDPRARPLLDRALAPLAGMLEARAGTSGNAEVERVLTLLGYPAPYRSVADVYACKVLYAAFGFIVGVICAVLMAPSTGAFVFVLLPLALAVIGYSAVVRDLAARQARRRERILFELPQAIDLLVVLRLKTSSIDAMVEAISQSDEGGFVMRELRMAAEDYRVRKTSLAEAFGRMATRNADTPLVERLAERIVQASTEGSDLVPTLEALSERARREVDVLIKERGEQNRALMIAPSIVGLLGIVAAMTAPAISQFGAFLSSP